MRYKIVAAPEEDRDSLGRIMTLDEAANFLGVDMELMAERSGMAASCEIKGYTMEIIHDEDPPPPPLASAYSLNLPFWIDDGELDGLTPQEIFVLGFEFCSIYGSILETETEYSRTFHSENEQRVRKMCEHLGVDYSIQAHDDWPVLTIRRKL